MMNILDRSALRMKNGLPYFEIPEMADVGWVQHGFLTRKGGVSPPPYAGLNLSHHDGDRHEHVSNNKDLIAMTFGFDPNRLILLHQIHQDKILILNGPFGPPPPPLQYDAVITNSPGTFLGILTADCLPIFMVDPKEKVIAAIHAGRQGTALHIGAKVVNKMKEVFGCSPQDLLIAMGPSIGPCCYEIDRRVFLQEWKPFSASKGEGRWKIDLAGINTAQIKREGAKADRISRVDLCTRCHGDLFFSYRREGQTGRQIAFIGISEKAGETESPGAGVHGLFRRTPFGMAG